MNPTGKRLSRRPMTAKKLTKQWKIIPRLMALEARDVPTAFTPGDLVLVKELSNNNNGMLGFMNNAPSPSAPIELDEYNVSNPAAPVLVQTVAIPYLANVGLAGNNPVGFDPANGSGNGQIQLSQNSSLLTFNGVAVSPGTSDTNAKNAARVIVQIGIDPAAAGGINSQLNGNFDHTDDDRASIETNSGSIYEAGHPEGAPNVLGGVRYFAGISTNPTNGVQTSILTNPRSATIGFDGRVYWDNATPSAIYTQQAAMPTTAQPSDILLFNNPTGGEKVDGMFLADMNGDGILDAGDRMYYTGLTSGLDVSVYNGTAWGTPISLGNPTGSNLIGLTAEVLSPTHVVLYGTTYQDTAGTNSYLVRYDDTGANPNPGQGFTTILTLPTTSGAEGYRGVSFAPMTPTLINLTSSTSATTPNTPVTFNATVTNAAGSLAGMTVNLIDNGTTLLAQPTVQANGTISFTTSSLPAGLNNVTLEYAGNYATTQYLPQALSNTVSVNVTGTNVATLGVTSSLNPSTSGQGVTFTATISGSAGTPTGTVTFTADGTNVLGTSMLNGSGHATITFSALSIGSHPVSISYSGDANYQGGSASLSSPQVVNAGATIALSSSIPTTTPGVSTTFTATVTGNGINPAPTGNVTFYANGVMIGSGPVNLVGNQAQLSISTLPAGSSLITATYNGDPNYAPVTSSQFIQNVKQAFAPGDLLVLRMGDYATQLGSNAAQVYLDEYSPSGTLVQSIAMPNVDSATQHILTLSGSAAGSGDLALSANGEYVTLAGIDAAPGTQVVTSTNPATTPRTIARIDSNADLDTSTTLTIPDGNSFGSIFGATTNDGKEFWIGGDGSTTHSGLEYTTLGASGTPTAIGTGTSAGFRAGQIFNGQLYETSGSSNAPLVQVGTGLPTTASTLTRLPGIVASAGGITDARQFMFFNTNGGSGAPNLLYIADLNQGILKYYYNTSNSMWTYVGDKLDFAGGVTGITGTINQTTGAVTLYGTGSKTSQGAAASNVFTFTDTNPPNSNFPSGNVTELANVTSLGETFRGVAFVPPNLAPVNVTNVSVGDGLNSSNPTGFSERSEVRSITVTFSSGVTFSGSGTVNQNAAAAFNLSQISNTTSVFGTPVPVANLSAAVSTNGSAQTVVTLTFSTSGNTNAQNTGTIDSVSAQNGGVPSLNDGRFSLTVLDANVTGSNGLVLNGGTNYVSPTDTQGGGPGQIGLYRLFGDSLGDGVDDQLSLAGFRTAFNSTGPNSPYVSYLDADNSNVIDQVDLAQFRQRFNSSVFPPMGPIATPDAATVGSVTVGDGSTQRSEVRSLSVAFSGPVTFSGGNTNAASAFQLTNLTDGNNVDLAAAVSANALGQTVVTLTFSGTETDALSGENGGQLSLADGRYQLTVFGNAVTGANGVVLNGGSNYVSPTDTQGEGLGTGQLQLYRLFGDANGDGVVDQADLAQFRAALNTSIGDPGYLSYLDADNSGSVDLVDFGQFRSRFNESVF